VRRRRRRRLGLLFLLLLGLAIYELPYWSAGLVRRGLEGLFHRPASVGAVRFHLLPFEAELVDVRVEGATPGAPPSFEVPRMWVSPSLGSLFSSRIVLSRVRLQGPKIRIHAYPEGGDDIPPIGGSSGGGGPEVRIHRLTIEGGEFELNHARVPLELDLPDFHGRLLGGRGGSLSGKIAFGPGRLRFGGAPAFTVGTDINLQLEGSSLTLEPSRVYTGKTDIIYSGKIHLAKDPVGLLQMDGPADLEELDSHVFETGFGLKGDARFSGTLSINGPRLGIQGHFRGTRGAFLGVPVDSFVSSLDWGEKGTDLKGLQIATLGGHATLNIHVPKDPGPAHLDADLHEVDAEKVLIPLFGIGAAGIGASATGPIALDWPKGHMRGLSGRMDLDLSPNPDGRTPLSGRFLWRAEGGVQSIDRADFKTPSTHMLFEGTIEKDDRTDLAASAESADLSSTDDLFLRVRRALGAKEPESVGVEGSGAFQGRWRGTLEEPIYEGRFTGRDVAYQGVTWGKAEWAGVATSTDIRSHSLVLRRDQSELWLDGRTETGSYGDLDALDLRVRFEGWPAADFIKVFSSDLDLKGALSGQATISGKRSAPVAQVTLTAPAVTYYGIAFSALEVAARLREHETEITEGKARLGGGAIAFRGTLSDQGIYDGSLDGDGVDVSAVLPPLSAAAPWGGRVAGHVVLQGTLRKPRLSGTLHSTHLFLGDEGIGSLGASIVGSGDGTLHLEAQCRSARLDVRLGGTLSASPPYGASLHLEGRDTSLDPFVRVWEPALPPTVGIVASGTIDVSGPLRSPRDLQGHATFSEVSILLPDYPIRNKGPLTLSLGGGSVRVEDLHLAGEGTDLKVQGAGALAVEQALALTVSGQADLRALSLVTRRLRGLGTARLSLSVSGRGNAPKIDGTLELAGAGIRVRGFPHGLEGVEGTVRFSETGAQFEGVKGTLGGGDVSLSGQAAYAQGRLKSFDVSGSGRGLALRYPEGLRSVIDADLRYFGDTERQWVTGSVDVRQALYTRRYDVASELLASGHSLVGGSDLSDQVQLDLKVRIPGTLRIDNNLVTLQARADLLVRGTFSTPVVLGRAEIDRGRVYFQGNTYVIQRGVIDFSDPQKIDPLFDIEAETRVHSYRVTLKINGTLERVYPTLTSDPPLSAVQILSLLAGADETTVESLTQTQLDQAKLAATGAATLAAGKISETVGLERGAERFFGLNRFSIDPSVLKTGTGGVTNPTARLTVGKRVTPDLSVLYSVDLVGANERILSFEYTLSDRFSVLLSVSQPGGAGFDVLLRQSR
jgi:translocation and assembly module TamB